MENASFMIVLALLHFSIFSITVYKCGDFEKAINEKHINRREFFVKKIITPVPYDPTETGFLPVTMIPTEGMIVSVMPTSVKETVFDNSSTHSEMEKKKATSNVKENAQPQVISTTLVPTGKVKAVDNDASIPDTRFAYSSVQELLQPDFIEDESFRLYEKRIRKDLQRLVTQEVNCFKASAVRKKKCFSYDIRKSKRLSKSRNEDDLVVQYSKYYRAILSPFVCDSTVIIGIPVLPSQFIERHAIRKTWCNQKSIQDPNVRCIFFTGTGDEDSEESRFVREESKKYNDIVQFDLEYSRISFTQLHLYSFSWVDKECANIAYFIHANSDVFVNVSSILSDIIPTPKKRFAYGLVNGKSKPIRDKRSRWYMPWKLYSKDYYPPFLHGYMYIWSSDILRLIIQGVKYIRPIHYLDDVYFGQILNYYRVKLLDGSKKLIEKQVPLGIRLWKQTYVANNYSPIDLIALWNYYT